jgi:hypothetical protein
MGGSGHAVRAKPKSASVGSDGHRINLAIFLPA